MGKVKSKKEIAKIIQAIKEDMKTKIISIEQFNNKKIKKVHLLIKLVREWELYRIRKGYMNPVEVTDVTKEHKEAYNSYVKWQIKKEEDNFLKLYNKFQKERKESVDKIVQLQENMDSEWKE